MMVPTKSLILAGAALALFGATASAQTQRNKLFRRASNPRQVTLDLGTGTYTRGPVINNRGISTVADLSNLDALDGSGFGWTTTDTGGGSCRWFQMGSKGTGPNQPKFGTPPGSDLMSDIAFFYCSGALDVTSGGTIGGTVELGFYEGYTIFGGAPTTTAALITITGMPANTAPGGFFGGSRCYGFNALFDPLRSFADGDFVGYSWHYLDVGTDGLYGSTYPFISCIVSCSGTSIFNGTAGGLNGPGVTGLYNDGQGMLDAFDAFCTGTFPNGDTSATYSFATAGPFAPPFAPTTRASVTMEVHEKTELAATNNNYNASNTPNIDVLTATPAVIGTIWTATYNRNGVAPTQDGFFKVAVFRLRHPILNGGTTGTSTPSWLVAPPTGIGSAGTTGRNLVSGGFLLVLPPTGVTGYTDTVGTLISGIPMKIAFCGLHFAAQARGTNGPAGTPRISSAVEGTIGTAP
jgi:hypothetical protein